MMNHGSLWSDSGKSAGGDWGDRGGNKDWTSSSDIVPTSTGTITIAAVTVGTSTVPLPSGWTRLDDWSPHIRYATNQWTTSHTGELERAGTPVC